MTQPAESPHTPEAHDSGCRSALLAERFALLTAAYGIAIGGLAGARLLLQDWGLVLNAREQDSLWQILAIHAAIVALSLAVRYRCRRLRSPLLQAQSERSARTILRVLIVLTPAMLLISADRIAAHFVPPMANQTRIFQPDAELGWRHRPGSSGDWWGPVTINEQGNRGPAVPLNKADGETRILFVGDSVTFGQGVDYDDCFVARVQNLLQGPQSYRTIRSINTGVSGYDTEQELRYVKATALKYEPDLILQNLCLNDLTSSLAKLADADRHEISFEMSRIAPKLEWSGLFRLLRDIRIRSSSASRDGVDPEAADIESVRRLSDPSHRDSVAAAMGRVVDDLDEMSQFCKRNGIGFAVVCFPYAFQIDPREPEPQSTPQAALRIMLEDRGIVLLDLHPTMLKIQVQLGIDEPLFYDRCHLTTTGHRCASQEIAAFLKREGLLPTSH